MTQNGDIVIKKQTVEGDNYGMMAIIDGNMTNVRNRVTSMPQSPLKSELAKLQTQVTQAIEALKEQGKETEAAAASKHLKRLAEDAEDPQTEPSQWAVTKKGLLDAIATVQAMVVPITATVTSILSLLKV